MRDAATASGYAVTCGVADGDGALAQLGAHNTGSVGVTGSSPVRSTFYVFSCLTIIMKPNLTLYTRDTIETYQTAKEGFSL